jgi:hypothetical protein
MGKLFYGNDVNAHVVPDRLLAHLKVVVATKLRRSESFTLSWTHPADQPAGRTTLWLQPSIPMRFVFDSAENELLHQPTLKRMADLANSSAGLTVDLMEEIPFSDARVQTAPATKPVRKLTQVA